MGRKVLRKKQFAPILLITCVFPLMFEEPRSTLQSLFWNIQGLGNIVLMWEHYSGSQAAWLEALGRNVAGDLPAMLPWAGSAAVLWVTLHDESMLEQLCSATNLILWYACGLRKISRFRLTGGHFNFQLVEDCFSVAIDNQSDSMPWIYLRGLQRCCLT